MTTRRLLDVAMLKSIASLVLKRLLLVVPLVLCVVLFSFILVRMAPGDPAMLLAGDSPTPEFLAQIRAEYGLDQPLWRQLASYIVKVLGGDFGTSIYFGRPVSELIAGHFPVTLLLTSVSMLFATIFGVALAVLAARYRDGSADTAISVIALIGYSIPSFWLGQLLILVFAAWLDWLPTGGMNSARVSYQGFEFLLDRLQHMILPVVTLMFFEMAMISRFTRTAMIDALDKNYITVAYAKGAGVGRVLWRHALPNALVTTVTIIGLEFGVLLAGAIATEIIFGWPGLGRLFFDAIFRRDFPLLMGCFIFSSVIVIVVNIVTDVVSATIDPRFDH
jgi:peptide/nickel transport system permease protein